MKRYIFVSGCPRSGTTALTTIVNWAPRTFLGQERFNLLFNRDKNRFTPDLFEPERLQSFQQFDCGYGAFDEQPAYFSASANSEALANLDSAENVGDKSISLWNDFSVFNQPEWENKDVHILHIVRNVFDVAASYQTRFTNESDGWKSNFMTGVNVWSSSVECVADWLSSSGTGARAKVSLVTYDGLFETDETNFIKNCKVIFEALEFDFTSAQRQGLSKVYASTTQTRARRSTYPEIHQQIKDAVSPTTMAKYQYLRDHVLI